MKDTVSRRRKRSKRSSMTFSRHAFRPVTPRAWSLEFRLEGFYLAENVCNVVLQKAIPTQIRQLIPHHY